VIVVTYRQLHHAKGHDHRSFCDKREFRNSDAKKVQGWICGTPVNDPDGRDLHMTKWNELVETMRTYQRP
jgi:hypothetical protein